LDNESREDRHKSKRGWMPIGLKKKKSRSQPEGKSAKGKKTKKRTPMGTSKNLNKEGHGRGGVNYAEGPLLSGGGISGAQTHVGSYSKTEIRWNLMKTKRRRER